MSTQAIWRAADLSVGWPPSAVDVLANTDTGWSPTAVRLCGLHQLREVGRLKLIATLWPGRVPQ